MHTWPTLMSFCLFLGQRITDYLCLYSASLHTGGNVYFFGFILNIVYMNYMIYSVAIRFSFFPRKIELWGTLRVWWTGCHPAHWDKLRLPQIALVARTQPAQTTGYITCRYKQPRNEIFHIGNSFRFALKTVWAFGGWFLQQRQGKQIFVEPIGQNKVFWQLSYIPKKKHS